MVVDTSTPNSINRVNCRNCRPCHELRRAIELESIADTLIVAARSGGAASFKAPSYRNSGHHTRIQEARP